MVLVSADNTAVAQYLEKHPEMAHELMIPSGFTQRVLRRYERYLAGSEPLSKQNGYEIHHAGARRRTKLTWRFQSDRSTKRSSRGRHSMLCYQDPQKLSLTRVARWARPGVS